jgi:hypothetical protein
MPYESVSEWVVCSHRREQYKDGQQGPQETRAVEGLVIRNRVTTNRCASRDVRVLGTPNRPMSTTKATLHMQVMQDTGKRDSRNLVAQWTKGSKSGWFQARSEKTG